MTTISSDRIRLLRNPILSQEEIDFLFRNPDSEEMDRKRNFIINKFISIDFCQDDPDKENDNKFYVWHVCVRLQRTGKPKCKQINTWMAFEQAAVELKAKKIMDEAGNKMSELSFKSKFGYHLLRKLTQEELTEFYSFNPNLVL